jgi:hypothetical protein
MLMNKSISLETVDLFARLREQRNSESSIMTESLVPPVKQPKLSFLRKIGIFKPPATLKKPSRWARAKAAICNSSSLLAKTLCLFSKRKKSDFEKKIDESPNTTVKEKLSTEQLQESRIIRARTSSRIQDISDSNVPEDLIEVKNQDIVLPTYGNGSAASGKQIFGNGDIAGNRNTSELRQNATNATRLVHQCSPVAFAIPDRSSTPIAPIASSVRFSTHTSSPHTATHLPSSVLIHPNVATAADHLYGESEVLVIQQPRSSVVNENIITSDFRLKNIFERGYPKNAQPTKVEETPRFLILRQKFLAGLDLQKKFKVRYKQFKVYEDLVRETDKYDRRLEAEKEEFRKRKFAIETQNEKINAITSLSRFNTDPPDKAIELIPNEYLTNRIMEILHHLIACQQPPFSAHQTFNANGKRGRLMTYYNYRAPEHQPSSCSSNEVITCGLAEGQMGLTV